MKVIFTDIYVSTLNNFINVNKNIFFFIFDKIKTIINMKIKILLSLLCFTTGKIYSQQYYGKKQMNEQPKAEFVMEDGSKINGFFIAYNYPNGSYPGFFDKNNIYSFEYKKTQSSSSEKLSAKDVKSLKLFDNDNDVVNAIEKLDMKYVDKNGKVEDKRKKSFQPLLYDGKIQIFGSNIDVCTNSICNYAYSEFYIRNAKDNFAVMPVDYDKMGLFSGGSLYDKMVQAFRYTGRNCPDFQKYMDVFESKLEDKSFKKEINEKFKQVRKQAYEDAKKAGYKHNKTQEVIGDYMLRAYLEFYGGIVKEYEKNCPY